VKPTNGLTASAAIAASVALAFLALPARARSAAAQETAPSTLNALTIVAPAAPGGGWDQLARETEREIRRQRLATTVHVENVPGAAGTIGLAQFIDGRRGDGEALLVNGLVMLGAILWNQSPVSIAQATPIARLTGEYEVVAVPASSPHHDMQSVVAAVRANPASVSWGGGSAGGTDHILAGLIVAAAGVDPRRTNYIAFSGGGEAVTALLGGQVTAGISGYSEFAQHIESGRLRAIGISAAGRVPDLAIASLIEQGLDVELANWRAVVAPPGLSRSQIGVLATVVQRMATSDSWRATLTRLGWTNAYLAGADFEKFLDEERVRVGRIVARLRASGGETALAGTGETVFPFVVLAASALVLLRLVVTRGERSRDRIANRSALARVVLGIVLFIPLMSVAGFVAAGTLLFVCTASAFGSRHWLRNAVIGVTLCAAVYTTFTFGLGVPLP
jgi:putative tricarboxylic transport membrane protein